MEIDQHPHGLSPDTYSSRLSILFFKELNKLYGTEKLRIIVMHRILYFANNTGLKKMATQNLEMAQKHLYLLQQLFVKMAVFPFPASSNAMKSLSLKITLMEDGPGFVSPVTDTCLILSAGNINQYIFASYRGLSGMASAIGLQSVAIMLEAFGKEATLDK